MTIKTSTGLRNALLGTGSLKATLNLGSMKIYAGSLPADADQAIGAATLLCTVTNNATATGLTFDAAAANGVITKAPAEIWRGVNAATGVATFYRYVAPGDDGTLSTTQPRVQGSIATAGGDLNLSSTSLTATASQTVDYYSLSLPTA
jgi:hypothetical protein